MLKGDLSTTTVAAVLRELADGGATGCIHVVDPAGETAKAYLRGGQVYAVNVPGRRPQLGARLVSSGALGPEALAEALEAQRTELQGWRLGELLVHLGYVDQPVVEAFVAEQVRESTSALLPWRNGTWKFRVNERTREDVAPPVTVADLLASIEERASTWATIEQTVHGPDAVPVLSAAGISDDELEVDPDAWSLLCKVDGSRSITDLARECGFTLYEAGRVVFTLVRAGLLEVEDIDAEGQEPPPPPPSDLAPPDIASRLISALSGAASQSDVTAADNRPLTSAIPDDDVTTSISRISTSLATLLGPATAGDDLFNTPLRRPVPVVPEDPKKLERARREAVRRGRDAAELAQAQSDLEAARAAEQVRRDDLLPADHVADVVDLHAVREAARLEDERATAELAAREAERIEAERIEAERVEAERVEAERVETERVEAQRVETERVEAQRVETERVETERVEAARVEAARVEAERVEAERVEAERAQNARVEAERVAAQRVEAQQVEAQRIEAERVAAEQVEAQRVEAERVEAQRIEAERVEADRVEAARVEAEQAEAQRIETERVQAERVQAERIAAEQAETARVEAQRIEAEQAEAAAQAAGARAEAARAEAAQAAAARAEAARLEAEAAEQSRRWAEQAEADCRDAEQRARVELEQAAELQRQQDAARAEFAEASQLEQSRTEQQLRDAQAAAAAAAAAEFAAFTTDTHDISHEADEPDRAAQAAAFAELSASASMHVSVPEPEPALAVAVTQRWEDEPMPYASHDTDTASLLRELTSLGLEDEPAAPPRPARPPAPRPVATPPKKKKGLFGR